MALDANGTATIYPPMLLQSSVGCSNNFTITVEDTLGNQYGQPLGASLLGQPLTATLLHPASGNSCDVQVTLIDNLPPDMDCGEDSLFVWCNQPLDSLGWPDVSDNVSDSADIEVDFTDIFTDLPCYDSIENVPVTAYVERYWTATDESGNSSTCVQHIFLKRATLDLVEFPKHRDGVVLPALQCNVNDPTDLGITGQPMIDSMLLNNETSCELVVSFSDQQVPICGGARKIIRTWSVFDLCTEDFRVFSQIIRVIDTTPPAITCPPGVSFTTYPNSCTAQVYLPQATATDGCSGATVTPSWQFGNGNGPFNNVPVGSYTVTYTAKDGCANSSNCQITVKVKDEKKPVALCENSVQANLLDDGTTLIFAETFDNGSYDNCGIEHYEVSWGAQPFDTYVSFECANIGQSIPVTLRVVDAGGLSSTCTSTAIVKDLIKPEILCPAPETISCGQNYNNPAMTGLPFATDNCTVTATNYSNQINLNSCGNGTVLRTWTATDQSGNSASCQQMLTVADNTPITVTFPDDILTYECEPDTDLSATGEPVVTGKDCEQLQITHTDYYFYTAQPACFKVIRNWAVIDWCAYQPNDPDGVGFWEKTQVIEVRDSVAPVLICPENFTADIEVNACQTFVLMPVPIVEDCSDQVAITNSSPFANNSIGAASGVFPKGTHTVTYTAADGCGNTSSCTMQVTVVDAQAPNPICNNGVSVTIQQFGSVTVTPAMINYGSSDNCTPVQNLVLQVSPNTFDCQSLGSKTVMLTVTDEAGNSAFCQTTVVVQDNFNICSTQTTATIAGKLARENGDPLSQKLVGLSGGISIAVHTDVDGTYDFPSLPLGQDYTLTPSYNTKPLNGVTTYDIVLVRRHILGIDYFDSPYTIIAADVNRSGTVTTLDLVDMQKLILNIATEFPNGNPSWRFVPADYEFPNPAVPFSPAFPENISMDNIETNQWDRDFVGIKIGDVNNSANPSTFGEGEGDERSDFDNALIFSTKDIELVAGHVYAIPFVAHPERDVAGFQFTLDFDENALEFVAVDAETPGLLKASNFGLPTAIGTSALTVSWANAGSQRLTEDGAVFALKFSSKINGRLSEVLAINSLRTAAEAYAGDFSSKNGGFETWGVQLEFEKTVADAPMLFQNSPNPFHDKTTLQFYLPEAAQVSFRLHDAYGRLLKTWNGAYAEGHHELPLDLTGLHYATGILFLEMDDGSARSTAIRLMKV
ncbi:MAG: HYR domain-containing protein [Bacteroidetes bacterium]|nr:HYR domain-containing protein [Bacteroidota bacterium]